MTGIRFEVDFDPLEYSLTSRSAITDTGTSCIIGPTGPVNEIRDRILGTSNTVV